jgi:hypothetical protein
MFAEVGVPLLAGMFLDINALVIATMIVALFRSIGVNSWRCSAAVTNPRSSILPESTSLCRSPMSHR